MRGREREKDGSVVAHWGWSVAAGGSNQRRPEALAKERNDNNVGGSHGQRGSSGQSWSNINGCL